jgi:protein TonB
METSMLPDVLTHSVQIVCVVAAGSVLPLILRVDASTLYTYWRCLLVLCVALPWIQPRQSVSYVVQFVPPASLPAPMTVSSVVSDAVNAAAPVFEWLPVIALVIFVGILLRLLRLWFGLWRLERLRTEGERAPAIEDHEELQRLVGSRAEIRYVPSGQPATFGFWRPVVLLPSLLKAQSPDIQRAVLCHELFHVQRRDWLWVVGEEIVRSVLWFNPAVLWTISRVRLAREEAIDELTVLATRSRRAYIEALLLFADAKPVGPTPAFSRRRHLFKRMVLISKEVAMSPRRVLLSSAAMIAVAAAGVWYAVATFPLTQVVSAQGQSGAPGQVEARAQASRAATPASQPGPLELRAKPITPENPIPRRTFFVAPRSPDGLAGSVGVGLRVVLDQQGRVGEVRSVVGVRGGRGPAQGAAPPTEALVKAAIDAARQWQYDPPADGPIAFDVMFMFSDSPGAQAFEVAHGQTPLRFVQRPDGTITPVAPPPPPAPPPPGGAVRVGGNVMMPKKIKDVPPLYPPLATSARVQGVVIMEVTIQPDGRVADVRVLRSIPLLDQAAVDAVRQWEFEPTHLNGKAVPVIMTATVQFSLPQELQP